MMRFIPMVAVAALLACAGSPAAAQTSACRPDASGRVDFAACVEAAPKGSPESQLALINLGTQAFLRRDYATAVRLYDEAQPKDGKFLFSDARFHAYRAGAYSHVGRPADALKEARSAFDMLRTPPEGFSPVDPEVVYEQIVPILKRAGDPELPAALAAYRALPAQDWISYANRAGVLEQVGDVSGALAANDKALALEPGHPALLNNACYILANAGRASEGLPHCEAAATAAPDVAPIQHSYAVALASLGRCADATARLETARRLDPAAAAYREPLACTPA